MNLRPPGYEPVSGRVATTPSMPNSASELQKHSGVSPRVSPVCSQWRPVRLQNGCKPGLVRRLGRLLRVVRRADAHLCAASVDGQARSSPSHSMSHQRLITIRSDARWSSFSGLAIANDSPDARRPSAVQLGERRWPGLEEDRRATRRHGRSSVPKACRVVRTVRRHELGTCRFVVFSREPIEQAPWCQHGYLIDDQRR